MHPCVAAGAGHSAVRGVCRDSPEILPSDVCHVAFLYCCRCGRCWAHLQHSCLHDPRNTLLLMFFFLCCCCCCHCRCWTRSCVATGPQRVTARCTPVTTSASRSHSASHPAAAAAAMQHGTRQLLTLMLLGKSPSSADEELSMVVGCFASAADGVWCAVRPVLLLVQCACRGAPLDWLPNT